MILFVAFFLIILGLVSIICVTTCVLGCEADTEHTARDLRHLVHLTKIRSQNLCRYFLSNLRYFCSLHSLPGLSREDAARLQQLRREVRLSEAVYQQRHANMYEVYCTVLYCAVLYCTVLYMH